MTERNPETISFSSLGRKRILADFNGGKITSDTGALLLRQVDKRIGLIDAVKPARPRSVSSGLIIRCIKPATPTRKRTYGLGRMVLTHQLTKNIRSDGPPLAPIATASEKTNIFYS
jgi:hypothetical protein